MSTDSMKSTVRMTKALADAQRLRIVAMLQAGELCVCQIVEVLGLAPSTVSKHLSILHAAGLVECRKEGRWAYYRHAVAPGESTACSLLQWTLAALRKDSVVAQDRKRLKAMSGVDLEALCRGQRRKGSAKANASGRKGKPGRKAV